MSDPPLARILSPKSPTLATAVFGSSPRPRRPSTPRSRSPSLSHPHTPSRSHKPLPPAPAAPPPHTHSPPSATARNSTPRRPDKRPESPDVDTMIKRTPRPRRKSSVTFHSPVSRAKSTSSVAAPSSWKGPNNDEDTESVISDYGALLDKDASMDENLLDPDGSESDSSIDIHTPLPHLMFRDGLLSPRSKLLPSGGSTLSLHLPDDDRAGSMSRANSVLSLASTAGSTMTKSGIHRDPRDTQRRRVRHRDQTLLRAGMGLTTGLGWSDSEDEDAPSLLTRRLIHSNIERQPSVYLPRPPSGSLLARSSSAGTLPRAAPLTAKSLALSRALSMSSSASVSVSASASQHTRSSDAEADSIASADPRTRTRPRTQSNASASSLLSAASRDAAAHPSAYAPTQTHGAQIRTGGPRPLRLPQAANAHAHALARSTSMATAMGAAGATRARTRTLSAAAARPFSGASQSQGPGQGIGMGNGVGNGVGNGNGVGGGGGGGARAVSAAFVVPVDRGRENVNENENENESGADPIAVMDLAFPLPPRSPLPAGAAGASGAGAFSAGAGGVFSAGGAGAGSGGGGAPTNGARGARAQVGLRPPRTGTGMAYRSSSYSTTSFYETARAGAGSMGVGAAAGAGVGVV